MRREEIIYDSSHMVYDQSHSDESKDLWEEELDEMDYDSILSEDSFRTFDNYDHPIHR